MPFLGQDWRSPGDQWVRTGAGWEHLGLWRLKLFESLNENVLSRLLKLAHAEYTNCTAHEGIEVVRHPKTYVLVKEVTKEWTGEMQAHLFGSKSLKYADKQKMRTSTAEALSRLDVVGAVRDHRRFNYVCKLVMYLIENKMSSLSGRPQKIVVNILEEIVNQAIKTQSNLRLVQKLLDAMQQALERGQYEHVGSQQLWKTHCATVDKLQSRLDSLHIAERQEDGKTMMCDLPDEVIRYIFVQLADHQDLVNAGLAGSRTFALSEENNFWRRLCMFHFTNHQWNSVLRASEDIDSVGWKLLYSRLLRRYGLRDVYAEMLHLCRHCNALFWQLHGHPCPVSNVEPASQPVSPKMFADLFSR